MSISERRNVKEHLTKDYVIRQKRIDLYGDEAVLKLNGHAYEIVDCTPFGIAIVGPNSFSSQEFKDVELLYHGILVSTIHVRKTREEKLSTQAIKVAFEVIGEPIEIEKIRAIKLGKK